ncbi:M12 family metallo-peptidase [Flavobacteriales bacterium]|nr:M12 family metallo-peptidase [Flavobacteriales bacterium]
MKTKTPLLRLFCLMLMSTALGSFWCQNTLDEARLFAEVKEDRSSQALVLEAVRQAEDAVALSMAPSALETLRMKNANAFFLNLPKPKSARTAGGEAWSFELERFFAHPATIRLGWTMDDVTEEMDYVPQLQSFRMKLRGQAVGSLILMKDHVVASFHDGGVQYDLMHRKDDLYVVADMNGLRNHSPFSCGTADAQEGLERRVQRSLENQSRQVDGGCVEIALDIDFDTWATFNNAANATEWALALMSGVEAIYTQELDGLAFLQASYVHIWQSVDPMDAYVNNAGAMLDNFRQTWESNSTLDAVQRDITHLISKRFDTGTGGIAYLGVNCGSYAYGFSANLNNTSNYNINSYSWNLDVVSHELGHNFGANHTHWCGWPGGAIDNCASAEGGCSNGPAINSGTIMSYCHTTSTGKTLVFHPLVESNALIPGISNAGCYTGCEGYTPPECAITAITEGTQLPCDPISQTYTQQVFVEHEYAPASGWLVVNGEPRAITSSPQPVILLNEPTDGQTVDISAYFTNEETCALSVPDVFRRRDPCCGDFRLIYVDPDSNILRLRNEADCPGSLEDWGMLSPTSPYTELTALVSQGQSLTIEPGGTVQLSWEQGLQGDWLMLFLPTNSAYDYLQWGPEGSDTYFQVYEELTNVWPNGSSGYIDALPPYVYVGDGGYGADQWSGTDIPCAITQVEVTSATGCNPETNTYDLTFLVQSEGTPETGGLLVNGEIFPVQGNATSGTLTLPANGAWTGLNVSFESEATCNAVLGNAYFGPSTCSSCASDINGNGTTDVADVLLVLSDFGCESNCNTATDLDFDGVITVSDVLAVLSAFGESC